jgi:hypothetical protein
VAKQKTLSTYVNDKITRLKEKKGHEEFVRMQEGGVEHMQCSSVHLMAEVLKHCRREMQACDSEEEVGQHDPPVREHDSNAIRIAINSIVKEGQDVLVEFERLMPNSTANQNQSEQEQEQEQEHVGDGAETARVVREEDGAETARVAKEEDGKIVGASSPSDSGECGGSVQNSEKAKHTSEEMDTDTDMDMAKYCRVVLHESQHLRGELRQHFEWEELSDYWPQQYTSEPTGRVSGQAVTFRQVARQAAEVGRTKGGAEGNTAGSDEQEGGYDEQQCLSASREDIVDILQRTIDQSTRRQMQLSDRMNCKDVDVLGLRV